MLFLTKIKRFTPPTVPSSTDLAKAVESLLQTFSFTPGRLLIVRGPHSMDPNTVGHGKPGHSITLCCGVMNWVDYGYLTLTLPFGRFQKKHSFEAQFHGPATDGVSIWSSSAYGLEHHIR